MNQTRLVPLELHFACIQPVQLSIQRPLMTKPKEPSGRLSRSGDDDDQVTPTTSAEEGQTTKVRRKCPKETSDPIPMLDTVCTYISFAVVLMFGHLAELLRKLGIRNDGASFYPVKDVRRCCLCSSGASLKA